MKVIRNDAKKIDPAQAEAAWTFAKGLDAFGYKEVAGYLHCTLAKAERILQFWDASDVLTQIQGRGRNGQRVLWRIKPECELPPVPRLRSAEDNLWTTMRHIGAFTPTDLAIHANTEQVPVGLEGAQVYCRALLQAGYLRVVSKARPPIAEARYKLIKNTGPAGPLIRRVRALVDLNTDAVTILSEVSQ
jgi:hypothetical protein